MLLPKIVLTGSKPPHSSWHMISEKVFHESWGQPKEQLTLLRLTPGCRHELLRQTQADQPTICTLQHNLDPVTLLQVTTLSRRQAP